MTASATVADPRPAGCVPESAGLIPRDDLVALLDKASTRKVTVICAPAGSGKTSLLRAWANRPDRAQRIAFLQVRRDEQDEQLFWLAVLSAVRQSLGTAGEAETPAGAPDFNARTLADTILSELASHRGRVAVIIDDLHELHSPDALAQLTQLLAELPANVHAILATRHDLRLGLHQLRLADELAEIRGTELRFTEAEARELVAVSGIELSRAGASMLHQRTEGWAAGLRLAVLSLVRHPDPERFVAEFSGSHRTVAEYLVAEMLYRQSEEVQQLLLRTSVLDRVNGELADLLTGRRGSERILLGLEDANAFVLSLDADRTWFRYHHMFTDLLRLELRRTLPEEMPELHRQAAGWYAEHGQIVDAIRHTQAAGDWSDAARLLADHAFSLTLDGQVKTVQALVLAFPRGAGTDPELAVVCATSELVQGNLDNATAYLETASSYADTMPPDRRRWLRTAIASLRLWLAVNTGSIAADEQRCREAIALAERHGWGTDPVVAPAMVTLADRLIWTGDFDEGEQWLQRAALAVEADDGPGISRWLHLVTGMLHAGRGRHLDALEEFKAAGGLRPQLEGSSSALTTLATAWALATQARAGMPAEARASLSALAQTAAGEIRNASAVICLSEGNPADALDSLQDVLDGTARVIGKFTLVETHLLAAMAHRQLGDQRAVIKHAERALALAEPDRLILPFASTGSRELLDTVPRHETAHGALLVDILDVLLGRPLPARDDSAPLARELSPGELRVLRYLPTNLSRPEIAGELCISVNTINTHLRRIYAKLGAEDRSTAVHRARELRLLSGARKS